MIDKKEALLRHATHFVQFARKHRTDLSEMSLNFANIMSAGDFCIQLTDLSLLASLTDAINEYLLRKGLWPEYIRLNTPLVTDDLTERQDARIARVNQLIEVEEIQGHYSQALDWSKFLIELHQSEREQDTGEIIKALKRMAKLSQRRGNDDDAANYLLKGLAAAREAEYTKSEIDFLFELALLYKKQGDFERSRHICESACTLARSIGYSVAELDILTVIASLHVNHDRHRALSIYEEALGIAKTLGDVERQATLKLGLEKLEELISIEQSKNRKTFISYTYQDREFVERLANDLKKHGVPVWWDQWEIRVGESIIQKVNEGIDSSAYLIAVLSSDSVQSHWVQREINSALMRQLSVEKNIIILPLVLADCEVPPLLCEIKWADFRNDYESGLKSLLERLQDTNYSGVAAARLILRQER